MARREKKEYNKPEMTEHENLERVTKGDIANSRLI